MPKIFYTERDVDDLFTRGVTSIEIDDNVVLTDLARERMFKYGMTPNRIKPNQLPEDNPTDALLHRIKAAVIARLGDQVDLVLLDTVIRRVLSEMK